MTRWYDNNWTKRISITQCGAKLHEIIFGWVYCIVRKCNDNIVSTSRDMEGTLSKTCDLQRGYQMVTLISFVFLSGSTFESMYPSKCNTEN